eukprot:Pompholyxophrys_sp_v1_NODE_88_length_2142_cov_5.228079.p4 type:complete len:107 gc:universal NODE_88_length_2142_cov_5.228079:1061-1381(+)
MNVARVIQDGWCKDKMASSIPRWCARIHHGSVCWSDLNQRPSNFFITPAQPCIYSEPRSVPISKRGSRDSIEGPYIPRIQVPVSTASLASSIIFWEVRGGYSISSG